MEESFCLKHGSALMENDEIKMQEKACHEKQQQESMVGSVVQKCRNDFCLDYCSLSCRWLMVAMLEEVLQTTALWKLLK